MKMPNDKILQVKPKLYVTCLKKNLFCHQSEFGLFVYAAAFSWLNFRSCTVMPPLCFFKIPFVVSCILFDNSPKPHTSVGSVMCERLLLWHGFHSRSLWLTPRHAHSPADFCDTSLTEGTMLWWKLSSFCASVANTPAFIHPVKLNVLVQISVNPRLQLAPCLFFPSVYYG